MNKVSGRIVVKETGAGIPDLVVAVFDLDPHFASEEKFENVPLDSGAGKWREMVGSRLGSVLTGADGSFLLEYEDSAFRMADEESRPDLTLMVTAPEEPAKEQKPPTILYASNGPRQNAGRNESYFLQLPQALLEELGFGLSNGATSSTAVVNRVKEDLTRRQKIDSGIREINKSSFETERTLTRTVNDKFKDFHNVLSRVPSGIRNVEHNYVPPGASVNEVVDKVIRREIDTTIIGHKFSGKLILNENEIGRLGFTRDEQGNLLPTTISSDNLTEMDSILFGARSDGSRDVEIERRSPPLELGCRTDVLRNNCVPPLPAGADPLHLDNGTSSGNATEPDGTAAVIADDAAVRAYVTRLLSRMTPPEEHLTLANGSTTSQAGRPVRQDVAERLTNGPSDKVAFYDFHNLQIAFPDVWQEAFDANVIDTSKAAYRQIIKSGGDIPSIGSGNTPEQVCRFLHESVPPLDEVDVSVMQVFDVTHEQWNALTEDQRDELIKNAETIIRSSYHLADRVLELGFFRLGAAAGDSENARQRGEKILRYADRKLTSNSKPTHQLLEDLEKQLCGEKEHAFTIYAADHTGRSINFGLLITYRQKWEPLGYQVGKLIKSVPLAPKEVHKYTRKTVVKKSRAQKEVENNLRSRKDDSSDTSRAESEIVRNAQNKSNFNMSAQGGIQAKVLSFGASSSFATEASTSSNDVKKDFREAVLKAADEYKTERTVEINFSDSIDTEREESGELINPNDEIPVTFLFYELQRRFRISEQIHRITPVIMVAQEVPKPHEIDEDWLVAHDWILRRVLLDDSFIPALNYLSTGIVGDDFALEELRKSVEQQRQLLDALKDQVGLLTDKTRSLYEKYQKAIELQAIEAARELPGSGDADERERLRALSARDAYELTARLERDLQGRIESDVSALNAATAAYSKALGEHLSRQAQVLRLRLHIKQNILYYMQAIWSHEYADQRFFRLHQTQVPRLEANREYTLLPTGTIITTGTLAVTFEAGIGFTPPRMVPLVQVADLDTPLGYKGNYMIFPLRESNDLTDFMMSPYLDTITTLRDPGKPRNLTLEEFTDAACCLMKSDPTRFESLRPQLEDEYRQLLSDTDEVTVPTGSLYIEALPGTQPILEDFKLQHRAVDVKKVQAEVRHMELENVRLAARLFAGEREDPDVEKKIVIEGGTEVVISDT